MSLIYWHPYTCSYNQHLHNYSHSTTPTSLSRAHNLIVCICRCMNEPITLIIHLAQNPKHIMKMFAIHQFSFISQCLRGHFREIWTRAMWDVANCNAVSDIHFGNNVDYHSIAWIWNGSDTNHIMTVYESSALSFVFVICRRWCWLTTHRLSNKDVSTWHHEHLYC